MALRRPAEAFAPGEILRDELEERGWTQADLAQIMGRPAGAIAQIVAGKRGITPETAQGLSAALGTSAEFWMNLDASYQLSRVAHNDRETIERRARLYEKCPIKEMIRRGWIEPSDNIAVLEGRVLKFFQIESLDDEPPIPLHAARKSTGYNQPLTPAQKAWLFRASQLARAVQAKPFSDEGLNEAIGRLRLLLQAPQEIRHVPRILSDAGIRFVIVQPLPGNRIDGACFWMDAAPVIALSLRHDRLDNFWFVLMHELGHVSQGAASLDSDLEANDDDPERPESERQADAFAGANLVPPKQVESFIARVRPLYSARKIEAFAYVMKVHPAIVVGQLQHRGEVAYSSFRRMLIPVRELVTDAALTDGWGATLPAQL
ncbi:MAG TPA: HigA family addiction module antitoxin [Thermomicrobiales bacterium]|nr:HigA family addiction module antitoxin [Thermomicrobiales bacterium]